VGSIEVMTTTWKDDDLDGEVTTGSNKHRKFTILSHVKNGLGKMFAKLDGSPATETDEDYTLRVTSNNGTTTTQNSVNVVASVNEVQNIRVISGSEWSDVFAPTAADPFRLYINKGKANEEFTEVVTHGSSNEQIAEAINSFSALSGPVKVDNTFHGFDTLTGTNAAAGTKVYVVTFDAIDGDVPLLHAEPVGTVTGGATLSTSTIRHGSSISGGAGARFEHMEAGGTINITSQETVEFTVPSGGTNNVVAFSYDGIMQSGAGVQLTGTPALAAALATITDAKNVKVVGATSEVTATLSGDKVTVVLKKGLSGSKLEMHVVAGGAHASTTKTVKRNNNGKTFRIKRVGHENFQLANNTIAATKFTITREDYNFRVGDEFSLASCSAGAVNAPCGGYTPCYVTATGFATTGVGSTVVEVVLYKPGTTNAADPADCAATLIRDTLVLDSVPDAMDGAVDIAYTAPSGSCSVSEVTKGSSESATCSNRGSCDGGSGLCVCHEGYSGEACETQTVLV